MCELIAFFDSKKPKGGGCKLAGGAGAGAQSLDQSLMLCHWQKSDLVCSLLPASPSPLFVGNLLPSTDSQDHAGHQTVVRFVQHKMVKDSRLKTKLTAEPNGSEWSSPSHHACCFP